MSFIADLHVHSHYSRATSGECTLEEFHRWAQLKGVRLVGTGDFTHPAWFAEMKEKLEESAPGLYRLRAGAAAPMDVRTPESCRGPVDFVISGEISSIYKRDGRTRKVHSCLLVPDLESAAKINARLERVGNIRSDGRPILGLDPRVLLEMALEINPAVILIPAHIWTPWFSMLGSQSGFDSVRECFGDLSEHIFAAETGLSSDPPMNWRVSSLDGLCLVSNSDLHSPGNMGRNANLFHCALDFHAIRDALRSKDPAKCGGTFDLFPEEGKYHLDGHRKCGVCLEPEESRAHNDLCPTCGKPLVLGVLHRVVELADRPKGARPATALPCQYIIPLPELLAEMYDCAPTTKKVAFAYERLLQRFGPEFRILRETDPELLCAEEAPLLGEAVRRLRSEKVIRQAGYDGEYGVIRVFADGEMAALKKQGALFNVKELRSSAKAPRKPRRAKAQDAGVQETPAEYSPRREAGTGDGPAPLFTAGVLAGLTPEQQAAAAALDAPVIIVAGPGTGKTRTLTHRIAHLVSEKGVDPQTVLAVTFTNRAAQEMQQRLRQLLGTAADGLTVATFHAFCLQLLRRHSAAAGLPADFALADQEEEAALLRARTSLSGREAADAVAAVSRARRDLDDPSAVPGFRELQEALAEKHRLSLDEVVPRCVQLLREHPAVREGLPYRWVCVDEYQDINRAQYELVPLLAPGGRGLCVIGDPDQAIYGFRGSDTSYFLRFTQNFADARVFHLSRNYRSSGTIVTAAAQVVAPGKTAMSVTASSALEGGVRLRFHEAATEDAEAEFITHEIEKWLGGTGFFSVDSGRVAGHGAAQEVSLCDIAVLVRLRALMKPLENALLRLGLPVQVVGDQPFADHPGARAVIEMLQNLPTGFLSRPAGQVLAGSTLPTTSLASLDSDARDALGECRKLAAEFPGTLREFLDHLLLRQGADRYNGRAEQITLMTLHAAKGLEFPVVFIAGCEAGILPYAKPGTPPDVDEERRLLYVGMTRAKQALYITSARRRMLFGKSEKTQPSPFIREIEEQLREELKAAARKPRPPHRQMELAFPE